jgi:predicted metalloprotease
MSYGMRTGAVRPPARRRRPGQQRSSRRIAFLAVALIVNVAIIAGATIVTIRMLKPTVSLGVARGDLTRDNRATIESLREFWRQAMPRTYGRPFVDLQGGFQPKTSASPTFSCNKKTQQYKDIERNAFYCGAAGGDYIAWDAEQLFPAMDANFGSIAPAVALAHEMGHAIQARAGVSASSLVLESQADCFAGAWAAFAERSGDDRVKLRAPALDGAVAAIITLRDEPGATVGTKQAHGSGFDRVNAFQTGYEQGTRQCAEFPRTGVTTTQVPFRTQAEASSGGNLPYNRAWPALADTLDPFWRVGIVGMAGRNSDAKFFPPRRQPVGSPPLPRCPEGAAGAPMARYCARTNTVSWADSALAAAHRQIGDLATGVVLADLWGRAGQVQAGLPVAGRSAGLQRDCMAGAWLASLAEGGVAGVQLSPGDLDEALSAILISTFRGQGNQEDRGDAFIRIKALRTGLLNRSGACATTNSAP